jgi:hypothetical protein
MDTSSQDTISRESIHEPTFSLLAGVLQGKFGTPSTAAHRYFGEVARRLRQPKPPITRNPLARQTGEARDQLAVLLPIDERVLGPEHPETLTARCNLALWTGEAGDAAGARDQFAALLPLTARVLGLAHPSTVIARASLTYWTREAGNALDMD